MPNDSFHAVQYAIAPCRIVLFSPMPIVRATFLVRNCYDEKDGQEKDNTQC
jgi:hypothetical protein